MMIIFIFLVVFIAIFFIIRHCCSLLNSEKSVLAEKD